MTPVMSRAQMRAYDKYAIEMCGVPSIVLMENAARGAADVVARLLGDSGGRAPQTSAARIVVVCGAGNNGGDGFAVARHLFGRGLPIVVLLVAPPDKLTVNPKDEVAYEIWHRQIDDHRQAAGERVAKLTKPLTPA